MLRYCRITVFIGAVVLLFLVRLFTGLAHEPEYRGHTQAELDGNRHCRSDLYGQSTAPENRGPHTDLGAFSVFLWFSLSF
jgi:hypothetical protein